MAARRCRRNPDVSAVAEIAAYDETPVFIDGHETHLAGVLTVPRHPNGFVILMPWGNGAYPSSGKNRIRARLARRLAEHGYHALRFDYRGVGESGGTPAAVDMSTPFSEDIVAVARWLAEQGLHRLILVGSCFGAWSALMASPELPGLEGLVMLRAPTHRDHREVVGASRSIADWTRAAKRFRPSYLFDARRRRTYRKMVRAKVTSLLPRRWTSRVRSRFSTGVVALFDRGIPVFFLYSEDDHFHRDLQSELDNGLGLAIETAPPPTRIVLTSERLQGFATLRAQDFILNEVVSWVDERTALSRSSAPT
jgi:alpha/beta superfamily hydrolase